MRPGVDGLQAVRFGGNDVEFTAVGLEKHVGGLAGEFEIGDENAAAEVHDGDAALAAAEDESHRGVRQDGHVFGLRHDGDAVALDESGGVMNAEGGGMVIHDEDGFSVWGDMGEDWLAAGGGAGNDGAGFGVNGKERVVAGGGGVDACAVWGKIERVGKRADGDAGDDLSGEMIGARVEDPNVAAGAAYAEDFGASGMLAHAGESWADGEAGDGLEFDEVDDGDIAVSGGDVGGEVEVRAEEGGAMVAQKDDDGSEGQGGEQEVETKVSGAAHFEGAVLP